MKLLPQWVLTNLKPGFYDVESGTAIEQTAKVYKTMNELIEEYNTFADNWNARIQEFTSGVISDNEAFRVALRQEFQDFIDVVELKIESLDQYAKSQIQDRFNELLTNSPEIKELISSELSEFNELLDSMSEEVDKKIKDEVSSIRPTIFDLSFNPSTHELTFKGDQTAEQLYNMLENNNPVKVRYTLPIGFVELLPTQKITLNGSSGYTFEAHIEHYVTIYTFTQSGFKFVNSFNNYELFYRGFMRVLTSDDDLNNIFEDGVYVYSTSSLPANAPFENACVIEVFGADSTSTQKIQRAYRYGEAGHSAFRPLYNNTWGEWSYPVSINKKVITGTTSAEGNLTVDLSLDDHILLSAYCVAGTVAHICIPYRASSTRKWAVKVVDRATLSPLTSTNIEITVFYSAQH